MNQGMTFCGLDWADAVISHAESLMPFWMPWAWRMPGKIWNGLEMVKAFLLFKPRLPWSGNFGQPGEGPVITLDGIFPGKSGHDFS